MKITNKNRNQLKEKYGVTCIHCGCEVSNLVVRCDTCCDLLLAGSPFNIYYDVDNKLHMVYDLTF